MSSEHQSTTPPTNDLVLGDLLPEEKESLLTIKQTYNEALMRVGEAYLRLNALAQRAVDADGHARQILDSVLERIGVPKDTLVQIHMDEGKVVRVPR